jgi:rhodanese-related sulfurtransferase
MNKVKNNIFYNINLLNERISQLENMIETMEIRFNKVIDITRSQLIRIKNHEEIANDTIYYGLSYNDLSPARAWRFYNNKDIDFIILDVSKNDFQEAFHFSEALKIPLEDLHEKCGEYLNKKTPILVICENGCRSTLACELLSALGYYNLNNVSGGHQYWPGKVLEKESKQTRVS